MPPKLDTPQPADIEVPTLPFRQRGRRMPPLMAFIGVVTDDADRSGTWAQEMLPAGRSAAAVQLPNEVGDCFLRAEWDAANGQPLAILIHNRGERFVGKPLMVDVHEGFFWVGHFVCPHLLSGPLMAIITDH